MAYTAGSRGVWIVSPIKCMNWLRINSRQKQEDSQLEMLSASECGATQHRTASECPGSQEEHGKGVEGHGKGGERHGKGVEGHGKGVEGHGKGERNMGREWRVMGREWRVMGRECFENEGMVRD